MLVDIPLPEQEECSEKFPTVGGGLIRDQTRNYCPFNKFNWPQTADRSVSGSRLGKNHFS